MRKKAAIPTRLMDRPTEGTTVVAMKSTSTLARLMRILWFVLGELLRHGAARLWWPLRKPGGRYSPERTARRVRGFLEKMGGIWVKAGQLLGMRRDLFDAEVCDELSKLHDRSFGFPSELARHIVEEDLGAPIEHHFSSFSDRPLAAASIGQAHEATLREGGIRVVVKVQRPNVASSFAADLRLVELMVTFINFLGIVPHGNWSEMLWELQETFHEELDYRIEAASIRRMRKRLREHKVYAPKVFQRLCSDRVLVMEYVEGVFMSEYIAAAQSDPARLQAWLEENNIQPSLVGRRLLFSHCRQLFEDNLYHCDLHPGNIVLLKDSRFALIDFGSVASIEKSLRDKQRALFEALAAGDDRKVVDIMLLTTSGLPDIDLTPVREELLRMRRAWRTKNQVRSLPYHEKSFNGMMGDLLRITGTYKIPSNWKLLRLLRSEVTLDASLVYLLPEINYIQVIKRYSAGAQRRAEKQARSRRARLSQASNMLSLMDMPARFAENAYFDGEHMRRRAINLESGVSKAAETASTLFTIIAHLAFLGGLAVVLVYTHQRYEHWFDRWPLREIFGRLPHYHPEVLGLLLLFLVDVWWTLAGIRKRLGEKDAVR